MYAGLRPGLAGSQPSLTSEPIVVSGASGHLGGLVVDDLLALGIAPGQLILVSRTPDSLARYAEKGASVRFGDFTKPDSLPAAYAGGKRMLLISVNGGGGGERTRLHRAAIDAAAAAGVQLIAYTSYVNADLNAASALATDHRETERLLHASGLAWIMLRNQIYANGLVDQAVQALKDGRIVTDAPDLRVAYVSREDCAAAAAAVLAIPGRENHAYDVTGPGLIGPRELAALAAEIGGKPVEVVALDRDAYVQRLRAAGESDAAVRAALGFEAELDSPYLRQPSTAVEDLTGRPAESVRALLEAHGDELRAAAATAQAH